MKLYKAELKIKSALITPLQGDTLFGHICWGIRYNDGEKSLNDFLELYDHEPPLVISNAFPHNMLPMPLLAPEKHLPDIGLTELAKKKELKKIKYLPRDIFKEQDFVFTERDIFVYLAQNNYQFEKPAVIERMHNTINRLNGAAVEEGGLYSINEIWYEQDSIMDVYLRSDLNEDKIRTLFEKGLQNGYGADKSSGKGQVELISISTENGFLKNGNRMTALGAFVYDEQNVTNLRADIFTKQGKLGGHFVYELNPFKKPLAMFAEGAAMDAIDGKDYIGKLLKGVHNNEKIRHHAFAPLIYFNEGTI